MNDWRRHPEARLLALALPLEAAWETAQLPLYTLWYRADWNYILYSLAHCTAGDLLILLVAYELVAVLVRSRYWFSGSVCLTGGLFTFLGAAYTVYSETANTGIGGAWEYTAQMPLVPMFDIGATPLLQWLLIPPLVLWLMRRP